MKTGNIKEILKWANSELSRAGIPNFWLDAEVILAHVLGKDRLFIYLESEKQINRAEFELYRALIKKRTEHVPLSYITEHKEFMSLDFKVNKHVLIPRPETEFLIELVSKSSKADTKILELGTGSGAIAISIAKYNPSFNIVATDISIDALFIARENAIKHSVIDRISFIQADLFFGISEKTKFDWIISNPPYISEDEFPDLSDEVRKYEPMIALNGGCDGLDIIRQIVCNAFKFLKPNGKLAFEFGYNQSNSIGCIVDNVGKYQDYCVIDDYANIPRIFCCQLK